MTVTNRKTRRQKAYRAGLLAEWLAMASLLLRGYRILAWRYRSPVGEVDIIAAKNTTLIAIEVKFRTAQDNDEKLINTHQKSRIAGSVNYFRMTKPYLLRYNVRIDAIIIKPLLRMRHVQQAWEVGQ